MPEYDAVITIDEIKKQEKGFAKFVAQGKTLNYKYNEQRDQMDFAPFFKEGTKVNVHVSEFTYKDGPAKGKPGRYVTKVWKADADQPNTWETPVKQSFGGGGGGHKKSDFDPTLSARQTAAHVAGVLATLECRENVPEGGIWPVFEVYAESIVAWLNKKDKMEEMVDAAVASGLASPAPESHEPDWTQDDDDIPF